MKKILNKYLGKAIIVRIRATGSMYDSLVLGKLSAFDDSYIELKGEFNLEDEDGDIESEIKSPPKTLLIPTFSVKQIFV